MRKFILYFTVLLTCLFFSCEDPNKDENFKVYGEQPIANWLLGHPEYSEWVKMLSKVDLFNALNLMTEYTCFVADNDVVATYLRENTAYKSVDEMPVEDIDYLIRYHILPGKTITSGNLLLKVSTPTASGFNLTAGVDPVTGVRYIDNGSGRQKSVLIEKDIRLINGVVHKLDRVLQPIMETVWDLVAENDSYSIFRQALEECGLQEWLDNREKELGEYTYLDEKTILIVSDSIFKKEQINSLADLKALYPGSGSDTTSAFYRFVTYHILNSSSGFAELTDFPAGTKSRYIYPYAPMTVISVVDSVNQIWFNPHTDKPVQLIDSRRDIPGNNGYIHELNGLLPVPDQMARYTVVWETTERPEFKIVPFYRSEKAPGDAAQTFKLEPGMIPGIRWESIPASAAKVWYVSENVDTNRFVCNDALKADLGKIGWIELDLPVLPAGKYNILVEKGKMQGGGKFTVWIDKYTQLGGNVERDFGTGGAKRVNLGEYVFTSEETHTIRFKMASAAGTWLVDRFIFEPVN